jgi:hypothetical protein
MTSERFLPEIPELEAFRRSVNRKVWAVIGVLGIVSLGSLLLALIAFARPIPVVAFDGKGHPILFEDTVSPRVNMDSIRVEAFTQDFLERWLAIDSTTVTEDFTRAVNMMTPNFRRIVMADADEVERRRRWSEANIKIRFETFEPTIADYDPGEVDGKIYVVVQSRVRYTPKFGELQEASELVKYYFTELELQRVPVAKASIHGLQVNYVNTVRFETEEELKAHLLKK